MTQNISALVDPRSTAIGSDARRALGGLLPLIDDPRVRDVMLHARGDIGPYKQY